jgi:hypothetical protein
MDHVYAVPERCYPARAQQFLEAVLSIPEKLRDLARKSKAADDFNARRSNRCRPAIGQISPVRG